MVVLCTGKKSNGEPCDRYANYKIIGPGNPRIFCYDHHDKATMTIVKGRLCKILSCHKGASYGPPGKPSEYCKKCFNTHCVNKEGIENTKRVRCVGINGKKCNNTPSFIPEGGKTPKYCKDCKPDNAIDKHEKCIVCKKVQASWASEGSKKRTHCADCARNSGNKMILMGGGLRCD